MHEEVSFDQQKQKFDCLICGKEFENSLNILMCYSKHFEFELVYMVEKLLDKKTKEGQELKSNTNYRSGIHRKIFTASLYIEELSFVCFVKKMHKRKLENLQRIMI